MGDSLDTKTNSAQNDGKTLLNTAAELVDDARTYVADAIAGKPPQTTTTTTKTKTTAANPHAGAPAGAGSGL